MESSKWWVEKENLERNLVVVAVDSSIALTFSGELSQQAKTIIEEVKKELGVEEYFAGVYNPSTPNRLYFQYPTQKIMRIGDVVRVNIPAALLRTNRDFVTIKRNRDGSVLIIP